MGCWCSCVDVADERAHIDLATEASLLMKIGIHQNVIQLFGICATDGQCNSSIFCLFCDTHKALTIFSRALAHYGIC